MIRCSRIRHVGTNLKRLSLEWISTKNNIQTDGAAFPKQFIPVESVESHDTLPFRGTRSPKRRARIGPLSPLDAVPNDSNRSRSLFRRLSSRERVSKALSRATPAFSSLSPAIYNIPLERWIKHHASNWSTAVSLSPAVAYRRKRKLFAAITRDWGNALIIHEGPR